jgi:hypothetical protein
MAKEADSEGKEKELYAPVKSALELLFKPFGVGLIAVTSKRIPDEIKERLDRDSLFYARSVKLIPDIMGYLWPSRKNDPPIFLRPGLIVAEVKRGPLKLWDIYQTRMYSELFDSRIAFLVSDTRIPVELRRFLEEHDYILHSHEGSHPLYIGVLANSRAQVNWNSISWYPIDPFAFVSAMQDRERTRPRRGHNPLER